MKTSITIKYEEVLQRTTKSDPKDFIIKVIYKCDKPTANVIFQCEKLTAFPVGLRTRQGYSIKKMLE